MSPTRCLTPGSGIEVGPMAIDTLPQPSIPITRPFRPSLGFLTATPIIAAATICLLLIAAMAIFAPWLAPHDPLLLATDAYGRDLLSRIIFGARISLLIGVGATVFSVSIGLVIGLFSGFFRWL